MSDYNTLVGSRSYENTNYIGYTDPRFCRPKNVYPYNNPTPLTTAYQTKESSLKTSIPNYSYSQPPNPQTLLYPYQSYLKSYEAPQTTPYEFR